MKRKIIQKALIEEASVGENFDRLFLWCRTPKGYVETSIQFDNQAPRHSYKFQQWRLVQHLLACHDIDEQTFGRSHGHCLMLRHFVFEFTEIQRRVWKITKAKKAEPFEIEEGDVEALDALIAEYRNDDPQVASP